MGCRPRGARFTLRHARLAILDVPLEWAFPEHVNMRITTALPQAQASCKQNSGDKRTAQAVIERLSIREPQSAGAAMGTDFGAGLHAAPGRAVDPSAYDRYIGRWSRLFVPSVLAAAKVAFGGRVLDVSTGTGDAALSALPTVGPAGLVVGVDIAPAMLEAARDRLRQKLFFPVAADAQALPFKDASFDTVLCQLGLQFFPDPALGARDSGGCFAAAASWRTCITCYIFVSEIVSGSVWR